MKRILIALCFLFAVHTTFSQIPIDSTIKGVNMWPDPTQEQLQSWFFTYWYTAVLQPDSVRLRPGNAFAIPMDGRNFTVKLDSVVGVANARNSHYTWTYMGQIRDSLTNEWLRDTTLVGNFDLPYTNWGEVDRCGNVKNPSTETYVGKVVIFGFEWINEQIQIIPTVIFSSGPNTQVLLRLVHSEIGAFATVPTSGYLIPSITVETQ